MECQYKRLGKCWRLLSLRNHITHDTSEAGYWSLTNGQSVRSHEDWYQLVKVHAHGDMPRCLTRSPVPLPDIRLTQIILTLSNPKPVNALG